LLALAHTQPGWAVGFADEVWWSREALPAMYAFAPDDQPLRLIERQVPKDDPDRKALACYGIYFRATDQPMAQPDTIWVRFVEGRPVSAISEQFLHWVCQRLAQQGKRVLVLIWDNATWHISQRVRAWIRTHNQYVKLRGQGVRILLSLLPVKSPWLSPIEPKWIAGKRHVIEPAALLSAGDLTQRICAYFQCDLLPCLAIPKHVS
jgi:transposase